MRAQLKALASAKAVQQVAVQQIETVDAVSKAAISYGVTDITEYADPPADAGESARVGGTTLGFGTAGGKGVADTGKVLPGGPVSILDGAGSTKPLANDREPNGKTIVGTNGAELLEGTIGDDSIYGNDGDDDILGGDGNDFINAGAGNDFVLAGNGNNSILGGLGDDEIYGGNDHDQINGGYGADRLYGVYGNDVIYGLHDNDYIDGGRGDDSLFGDGGQDVIYGGDGKDYLSGGADGDVLDGQAGNDTVNGGDGDDVILGGADNDTLSGDYGADLLLGGTGDDILYGGPAAGDGADTLLGEAGRDKLNGGGGNDRLNGGADADVLTGGAGRDTFVIANFGGQALDANNIAFDVVADFQFTTDNTSFSGDWLDLGALFDQLTNFTGSSAKEAWQQGYLRFTEGSGPNAASGLFVTIDRNGNAADVAGQGDVLVAFLTGVDGGDFSAIEQPMAFLDKYIIV